MLLRLTLLIECLYHFITEYVSERKLTSKSPIVNRVALNAFSGGISGLYNCDNDLLLVMLPIC